MAGVLFEQSAWANRFAAANTAQDSFDLPTGGQAVPCNMMNSVFGQYAAEYSSDPATHQAIRIPFAVSSLACALPLCCELHPWTRNYTLLISPTRKEVSGVISAVPRCESRRDRRNEWLIIITNTVHPILHIHFLTHLPVQKMPDFS